MGHKFSLVLSREITDDESAILRESVAGTTFTTDSLPTNADVTVTRVDVDDTASPSLAEAIEAGLEAVKKVPDLSVPGLTVPAQPVQPPAAQQDSPATGAEDTTEDPTADPTADTVTDAGADVKKQAPKKTAARSAAKKPAARKTAAKKPAAKKAGGTDDAAELVEAAAGS